MKEFLRRYPPKELGTAALVAAIVVVVLIPTEQGKTLAWFGMLALGYGYYRLHRKHHPLPTYEETRARTLGWITDTEYQGEGGGVVHPASGARARDWSDACRRIDEQAVPREL